MFEIFIFCPKNQLWFPEKNCRFFWVKNSWKCCGFGHFSCWQLWFHEKNFQKIIDKRSDAVHPTMEALHEKILESELQWSWSLTTTSITASLWLGRCITSLRHLLPFRICLGILAVIFLKHIKKTKKVFISLFKNHSKTKLVSDIMFENPFKKYNFDYFWRKIWNVSKIENHVIFLHENFNDLFWVDILRLCIGRLRRH